MLFFLPVVFWIYWQMQRYRLTWQNLFIVGVSYLFYGWWNWRFLLLISFTSICSYLSGLAIRHSAERGQDWTARLSVTANIVINLLVLGVYKYYDFFVNSLAELFTMMGVPFGLSTLNLILPVGISFYTFQALSYTVDVYKRRMEATTDVVAFFAYVSFFPQLVAGPIERATNLLPQFQQRRTFSYADCVDGLQQVLWGLFKKLVVADNLSMASYASSFDKLARLDQYKNQNRLVIIGGSNTRFSIHSQQLQDCLRMPVVNMGIHIGLGLNYMFEEVFDKLHSGDVLVVGAEYQHYLSPDTYKGDSGLADMLLMKGEWLKAFRHIYEISDYVSLYRLTTRRFKRMRTHDVSQIPASQEIRQRYNSFGDYVGHYPLPSKDFRKSPIKTQSYDPIQWMLEDWIMPLKKRGVKILFICPPLCQTVFEKSESELLALQRELHRNQMDFVNDLYRSVWADSCFYDSPYHLTCYGGSLYTQSL